MNYETIANIHAKMLDRAEEMQNFIDGIAGNNHWLAKETRKEWKEQLQKIEEDKADFLDMVSKDPVEAVKSYYEDYLFPNQLGVKRELESL